MGSKFKKAVVSENVRESLSKWKRRVKEKQGSSVGLLKESRSTSSLDSMGTDINKKTYSFGSSSTSQRTPTESSIHESSSPRGKKLKAPLSFYLEDYISNHDMNDAHNNDDKSDVEDEISLLEP